MIMQFEGEIQEASPEWAIGEASSPANPAPAWRVAIHPGLRNRAIHRFAHKILSREEDKCKSRRTRTLQSKRATLPGL